MIMNNNNNNRIIGKFPFKYQEELVLKLPKLSKILRVEHKEGEPCLWAEFEESNKNSLEDRILLVVPTGTLYKMKQSETTVYIGTLTGLSGGIYVHVLEKVPYFDSMKDVILTTGEIG